MLRWQSLGWWGLAIVSMGGPLSAADVTPPRISVPIPKVAPVVRPPPPSGDLRPPNVDAGRGVVPRVSPARPSDTVPLPGPSATGSPGRVSPNDSAAPQKKASRAAPVVTGGGGLEGVTVIGGGGLSSVPTGGGGFDAQALRGPGPQIGTPQ